MQNVHVIAQEIVAREGGYVNDPDDPGGATKYGVTIHTMRRLGLDLDGDGDVDASDVRQITIDYAVEIFVEHYCVRPGISALPEVLQASVFDMYVNAGGHAFRILQRLIRNMRIELDVDGMIGPRTIAAAHQAADAAPEHLTDAYGIARRNYYYALGDRRVASRKYARRRDGGKGGWITRAEAFITPRYHLTDAEHSARVASWV
jgi:lysozyme family protein